MTRTVENTLVVDDWRTMKFEATTVRTLDRGIEFLYSKPWDEVWLDFDLGGQEDMRPLVSKVEEDAINGIILPVKMFVLHTGMGVGKHWMAKRLLPWYTVGVAKAHEWADYPVGYVDWDDEDW
jgi:hypothetical protein